MPFHDGVLVLGLSLVSALGCGSSTPATPTPPVDPLTFPVNKPGPFSVGYRQIMTSYTPPAGLPQRTIPIGVWYPTNNPLGDNPTYGDLVTDTAAFTGAAPAPPSFAGGYPVLVHSHGDSAFAGSNSHVIDYLVSHGWAVVEPDHVGNTLTDDIQPRQLALYLYRPLDVRAALDLAANLPAGDALAGKFDMTRVAMSGHSFGTYSAWAISGTAFDQRVIQDDCAAGGVAACSDAVIAAFAGDLSEPRARVIVPMAGGTSSYFGTSVYNPRGLPLLLMSGGLNEVGDSGVFAQSQASDSTWIDIAGGCHELFNLGNTAVGNLGNGSGTPCSVLPDDEGFAIVNTFFLAYLRAHILGDTSAAVTGIVNGTSSVSPRVTYQHR